MEHDLLSGSRGGDEVSNVLRFCPILKAEKTWMKRVLKQGTDYKTAPLEFLPTKYSQMVMPFTSTAFTEGMDENPYNSNVNLIENSINKERWSGGVLQIHQNSLQLSPVVLMIHWSFSRKLRDNFSSLQELSKKKKIYIYWH